MLMLFWRDVWCSGWRISVDRWCFNPVCALSTSHPPPHHASLRCYIDPYTSPSSSHRKHTFLFACLHCSLNNPARSGSKKSTRLFHVTRVYIYTHTGVCDAGCVYITVAQKPTNTSGRTSPRARLTWENTERLFRFLIKQFVFTRSVLHHLTHISAKARLLCFLSCHRDKHRQQRRFSNTAVMTLNTERSKVCSCKNQSWTW